MRRRASEKRDETGKKTANEKDDRLRERLRESERLRER